MICYENAIGAYDGPSTIMFLPFVFQLVFVFVSSMCLRNDDQTVKLNCSVPLQYGLWPN